METFNIVEYKLTTDRFQKNLDMSVVPINLPLAFYVNLLKWSASPLRSVAPSVKEKKWTK